MCGIAGILTLNKNTSLLHQLKKMTNAIAHRGPDGEGHWVNNTGTVALGHRRLAILDLSNNAAQPMQFEDRYVIVYNGELYNYIELKETLYKKGYIFRSKSDTEVIIAAYDYWGHQCLDFFDGMFAFAIWDKKEEELFIARDRFGEKPFYYFHDSVHFIFASEMKALWSVGIPKEMNHRMMLNYLTLGYVNHQSDKEVTFYKNIFSLPSAHYCTVSFHRFQSTPIKYWDINRKLKIKPSEEEAIEKFSTLFTTAVKKRLRSDVAIGTSLSGGLDSSAIVAVIQQLQSHTLQTFSATFPGFEKDESAYIKNVADQFNIKNFQVQPTADDLVKNFEKLCYHQEEPFQSTSIFAQYKVFELAKHHNIKVLIDGQGADESLAGYHKYLHWYLQELISRYKFGMSTSEKFFFKKNKFNFHWGIKNYLAAFFPVHSIFHLERKEYKKIIRHQDINEEYLQVLKGREWEGIHKPVIKKLDDILYFNIYRVGLEELLRYADRNSMAHGVEVRLPFLNHHLVEYIFSLPSSFKIREGNTKWLLRKAMDTKLPANIVWRTDKVGYEPPQQQWMKDKLLKDYIHEAKKKLVIQGILNKEMLNKQVRPLGAHEAQNFDWRYLTAAHFL